MLVTDTAALTIVRAVTGERLFLAIKLRDAAVVGLIAVVDAVESNAPHSQGMCYLE